MAKGSTAEHMLKIGKKTQFSTETGKAAQPLSVIQRNINDIVLDGMTKRLMMTKKGSSMTNCESMNKKLVESAADGDIQAIKIIISYAMSNAPKESTVEKTETGIRVVTNNAQVAELINELWHKTGE